MNRIDKMLKAGNSKTGKGCKTYSTTPGTCGSCCCDCPGCYAKTGCYCFPSVKESLAFNLDMQRNHTAAWRDALIGQIRRMRAHMVRIHAAGDLEPGTAEIWHEIAAMFSGIKFWTYTKRREYEALFDDLPNANVVRSIVPGIGMNFGPAAHVIRAYKALKDAGENVYICPCDVPGLKGPRCQDCGLCARYKYVLFLLHGDRRYDATTDENLPELIDLITDQADLILDGQA